MSRCTALGIGVCLLLAVACAPQPAATRLPTQALVPSTDTPLPAPTVPPSVEPSLAATEGALPESNAPGDQAQVLAGRVLDDLARRLRVTPETIEVRAVETVRWARLSCEPVADEDRDAHPGFRIVLEHGAQVYVYHADTSGEFLACDSAGAALEGEPVILDTSLSAVVDLAQRNLATRLDLPLSRVFLVDAAPALWVEANLGCAPAGAVTLAAPVAGYRIVLRVGMTEYYYHTNYRQVMLCDEELVTPGPAPSATEEATAVP